MPLTFLINIFGWALIIMFIKIVFKIHRDAMVKIRAKMRTLGKKEFKDL